MNARYLFSLLTGAALVLVIFKSLQGASPASAAPKTSLKTPPKPSPIAAAVEQTLHQHEGEQSAMVEAFAHALHPTEEHGA